MGNVCTGGVVPGSTLRRGSHYPVNVAIRLQRPKENQFAVRNSFKHSESHGVHETRNYTTNHCLLRCFDENVIKLTDKTGKVTKLFKIDQAIDGFTLQGKNILLCFLDNTVRKIHIPSGRETHLFDTGPLCPLHIANMPNGDILLTLCDKETMPVESHSQRVVIRYDLNGNELNRAQITAKGHNIFVVPRRLCTNKSGSTVAVTNKTADLSVHLVLLNERLELTVRYTGHGKVLYGDVAFSKADEQFCVNDVKFTSTGDILIAEEWSKTVQLLSPFCLPLWVLLHGNVSPTSVSIQNNGHVWVGNIDGSVMDVY